MPDTTQLYTVVKNTSGATKTFSFLPPHGRVLTADQEVSIAGNIVDVLHAKHKGRAERHIAALEAALLAGELEIKSLPVPIVYDETEEVTKAITVDDGSVSLVDPSWADEE